MGWKPPAWLLVSLGIIALLALQQVFSGGSRNSSWGSSPDMGLTKANFTMGRESAPTAAMAPPADMGGFAGGEQAYDSAGGAPAPMTPSPTSTTPGNPGGTVGQIEASAVDRYLIRNASLSLELKDVAAGTAQLLAMVEGMDGYVSDLQESTDSYGQKIVNLSVRVPARSFDKIMLQFGDLGTVLNKQISAQDVTEEFVDTEAGLRNLRDTEERLRSHLHESKKLADTLAIENELTRVLGQIEQLEGRLRYLSHRVDFATISVSLVPVAQAEPVRPAESYSSAQEFSEAMRSLIAFLLDIWSHVIWWGVWSIVWLPIVLVVWILWRRRPKSLIPQA